MHSRFSQQRQAFATPFALDAARPRVQVEVAQPEADQLGDPQARRVEDLEHGAVPDPERRLIRRLDQRGDLLTAQHMRYPTPTPRPAELGERVIDQHALPAQERQKS